MKILMIAFGMEKFVFVLCGVSSVWGSFLEVDYPNVNVSAERRGDAIFEAGLGGSVFLRPGTGGTLYIDMTDMKQFIEKVKSMPPIWTKRSQHGNLGTFYSGQPLSVMVEAMDPDGGAIIYSVISGHLPPGTSLNMTTGVITGQAPDIDATYTFGIRATDNHGKYADGVYNIDIREKDQCGSSPCYNGGICRDDIGKFKCTCATGYGDDQCKTRCSMNAFGVAESVKKIPDAQLSAHLTYSTYSPWEGRLGSSTGWVGNDNGSWLQVDTGAVHDVYGVAVQGFHSSSYYISSFRLSYSVGGNTFSDASTHGSRTFAGSSSYDQIIKHDLDTHVTARFLRFAPVTWHQGGHPGMRVEVYGC